MVQYVKQGSLFGRIGSGIGKGLAEQLPQEITRGRLAEGLNQLGNQQNLTPFQQFAGLASLPGITPQMIQSGAELLRQQGIAQGFRNVANQQGENQQQQNPLRSALENRGNPNPSQNQPGLQQNPSGLVKPEATRATINTYIPKTREQLISRAADLFDQNRALYPNPESAFQAAVQEDAQNQSINQAQQAQRQSQIGVEDRLRGQLSKLRESANVKIPDNVYQQVENDVIDKVKDGKGELEAAKDGQKKLDEISRQYKGVETIGNWTLPLKNRDSVKRSIESLRQDFKKREDLENFADSLVGMNGLSFAKGYWRAFPTHEYKSVDRELKSLPRLNPYAGVIADKKSLPSIKEFDVLNQSLNQVKNEKPTLEAAKKLGPLIKSSGASPLAVAEELRMKNYNPDVFLDYLVKNKEKLDLSQRQGRELDKPRNWFPSLNDLWLFLGEGNDKIVEE